MLFCYVLEVPLERIGAMASHFQLPFWRARRPSTLDVYVGLVVLAGLLVCGALLGDAVSVARHADLTFWVLAACVLPAEVLRITIWQRGLPIRSPCRGRLRWSC